MPLKDPDDRKRYDAEYRAKHRDKMKRMTREWSKTERGKQLTAQSRENAIAKMRTDSDDKRHGTPTGYGYGCRCFRCIEAQREYHRTRYALAHPDRKPRPQRVHGTTNMYKNHKCRCEACKVANTELMRRYREKKRASS